MVLFVGFAASRTVGRAARGARRAAEHVDGARADLLNPDRAAHQRGLAAAAGPAQARDPPGRASKVSSRRMRFPPSSTVSDRARTAGWSM